ncbi:hypothetical protein ACS0TY_000911 [Phlomoides rotata]
MGSEFRMPLHYPRYTKREYQDMPEWMVDRLLTQYGLPITGDLGQKRRFAMGAFLWPTSHCCNNGGVDVSLCKKKV